MVFDLFSIGDSAFLEAILNAVAMIAGTGHYTMAAGVGALLGTILMLLRGILQWDGRGIRYQEMIAAILIYLAMFAPSVKVAIEDAYTGQVRVVDNVPLGPAVAGSILSNIGYRLTRLFEQGFSTPSMTQYGFADALQVVTAVRKNLLSRVELGKANAPTAGGDLENSLINYVRECTLTGVDLNLRTEAERRGSMGFEEVGRDDLFPFIAGRLRVLWDSVYQMLRRLLLIIAWWPFLLAAALPFALDGMVQRKIKQSNFAYSSPLAHRYSLYTILGTAYLLLLGLTLPFPIPPQAIPTACAAVALAMNVYLAQTQKRV